MYHKLSSTSKIWILILLCGRIKERYYLPTTVRAFLIKRPWSVGVKRIQLRKFIVFTCNLFEIFRKASRLQVTFIRSHVTSRYEIFYNIFKYVRKICKRNAIHRFLINENTTKPISMRSKSKLLNTLLKQGWQKWRARAIAVVFWRGTPRED